MTLFGKLTPEGELVEQREISQANIMACPHVIMVPEHYREDGTCRCDDPEHVEMSAWGYRWRDGGWR